MKLTGKKIVTLVAAGVEDLEYYVPLVYRRKIQLSSLQGLI